MARIDWRVWPLAQDFVILSLLSEDYQLDWISTSVVRAVSRHPRASLTPSLGDIIEETERLIKNYQRYIVEQNMLEFYLWMKLFDNTENRVQAGWPW